MQSIQHASKIRFYDAIPFSFMLCLFVATVVVAEEEKKYGELTLDEWSQLVKSSDFKTLGQPVYVNGLTSIVEDEEAPWASRRQAAETLGRIGQDAESAIPLLEELLKNPGDQPVDTRLWVLKSLSLYGTVASDLDEQIRDIILNEEFPHLIRVNAMETLGRVGKNGNVALPTYLKILQEGSKQERAGQNELRVAAVEALWILGPAAAPALSALVDAAREDRVPMRLAAITSIGQVGPRGEIAIPTLVDAILFDEAGEVREAAADALGKIGIDSVRALQHLQKDHDESVRQYVIRSIKQMKMSDEVSQLLDAALQDSSEIIQTEAAAEILRRDVTHQAAQQILLDHLGAVDRRVRLNAYQALDEHLEKSLELQQEVLRIANDIDVPPLERSSAKKLLRKLTFDQRESPKPQEN